MQAGYENVGVSIMNLFKLVLAMSSAEMEALQDGGLVVLFVFVIIIEV
jgi:hypothetical protein